MDSQIDPLHITTNSTPSCSIMSLLLLPPPGLNLHILQNPISLINCINPINKLKIILLPLFIPKILILTMTIIMCMLLFCMGLLYLLLDLKLLYIFQLRLYVCNVSVGVGDGGEGLVCRSGCCLGSFLQGVGLVYY